MGKILTALIFVMALLFQGCQGGSSKQPVSDQGLDPAVDPSVPLEETEFFKSMNKITAIKSEQVTVFSPDLYADSNTLDFGDLPADDLDEDLKFMNPNNHIIIYISNISNNPIEIGDVKITNLKTEEASSPFDSCGGEFQKFTIPAGFAQEEIVCFYPKKTGMSKANISYFDNSGNLLFDIPLQGQGRDLKEGEPPPMGSSKPYTPPAPANQHLHSVVSEGEIFIGGKKQDPELAPPGECLISIAGGGFRPNPAIRSVRGQIENSNNVGIDKTTVNVGQLIGLTDQISCTHGYAWVSSTWVIEGEVIKDYKETLSRGRVTTTPLTPIDKAQRFISFYWKNTGTFRVTLNINLIHLTPQGGITIIMPIKRDFTVERNDVDINRQMEDFYTWNHEGRVLVEHNVWHAANRVRRCSNSEELFLTFHKNILGSANGWRNTFGYPNIASWDPATRPPTTPESNHSNRSGIYRNYPKPTYYTKTGGRLRSGCHRAKKLNDFDDADELSEEMEGRWHNSVHGRVGGDMRFTGSAMKDPVFYRWHKTIDKVYDEFRNP